MNGQADPPCAETLLERAWDENGILFTNSVRVTHLNYSEEARATRCHARRQWLTGDGP
ncbi:hypothetical protein [Microbacterium imperiale]|uniref:hypothetical protein n=1 Tax=Microbacterium imperiale TaxID=33884 RepID=UPI001AE3810F|nr:hypothetical protein [Microbacterium imperiale]MBP2419283.1 hypothetical protein [Microbacterium imperiale]MDS0198845.1 hypothetical protein [Microbacterium imperiale]